MHTITPNKEVIRRICLLNGATTCYIAKTKGKQSIEVLVDIKEVNLTHFSKELSEWSGIMYQVYSLNTYKNNDHTVRHIKEKILPIEIP